ncbi:MAG: hypothetical protein R3A10_16925 [Caldilineaceae bacterium]
MLTTAIVLEARKGAFDLAIALGIILLGISFIISALMLAARHDHWRLTGHRGLTAL